MKVQSRTEKYQKPPKTEVTITKKAKVPFFRPTVLLDHAASRLVKKPFPGDSKEQNGFEPKKPRKLIKMC